MMLKQMVRVTPSGDGKIQKRDPSDSLYNIQNNEVHLYHVTLQFQTVD